MGTLKFRSVDTMKGSKDSCDNPWSEAQIAQIVGLCAGLNLTHLAVSTPWDYSGAGQFTPAYLRRWVAGIRAAGKSVWFRCHPIGWERDYGATGTMTPAQYLASMDRFIRANADLFRSGDIWDGCPEPENGKYWNETHSPSQFNGWMYNGAPNAATAEYSQFFIDITDWSDAAFAAIGQRGIVTTIRATNGTVAQRRETLHPEAVARMGRITTDSFTGQGSTDPATVAQSLIDELDAIRAARDAVPATANLPIVLGERGYSTTVRPDDEQQRAVIAEVNRRLATVPFLEGDNYWVAFGEDNTENSRLFAGSRGVYAPRPAAAELAAYFAAARDARELPLTLTALSPATALAGGDSLTLAVQGSGFTPAAKVRWNGADRPTTYLSAESLSASIGAADIAQAATAAITVADDATGRTSAPRSFPVGGLLLSPQTAPATTGPFALTVTGLNLTFAPSAVVYWNGQPRATRFISATELRAEIPASDLARPGAVQVTVQ